MIENEHLKRVSFTALFLIALGGYVFFVRSLDRIPLRKTQDAINVAVPAPLQVVMAGGDRYLAANLAVFRALVIGTEEFDRKTYEILARVQRDAARLNPAHEDNYYISQAILPWSGEVEADLFIQKSATESRPWDFMPAFFWGFDRYYFLHDPSGAAKIMEQAADKIPENRESFLSLGARWREKGGEPREAKAILEAMAESTRDKNMQTQLRQRAEKLGRLVLLHDAAKSFVQKNGRAPSSLQELMDEGLTNRFTLPSLEQEFTLDQTGTPALLPVKPAGDEKIDPN